MSELYSCCEGLREPDWSRYAQLEVSGSKRNEGVLRVMVSADEAEFFTVYGQLADFKFEAITECTESELESVIAELGRQSKLNVLLHKSLFDNCPTPVREPGLESTDETVKGLRTPPKGESFELKVELLLVARDVAELLNTVFAVPETLRKNPARVGKHLTHAVGNKLAEQGVDFSDETWTFDRLSARPRPGYCTYGLVFVDVGVTVTKL